MSSVQSHLAKPRYNPTKIFTPNTTSYLDTLLNTRVPIPFYVTNKGVLEIRIQDNVQANLLTVGSFVGLNSDPNYQCKVMGGFNLVMELGQTVKDFLRAWIHSIEGSSPSGEFELVVKPVMTKIQFSTNPDQFHDNEPFGLTDYAPSGSEYVTGADANEYRSVWAFQSPMTVKYYSVANGKYRYANLTSAFDGY